MVASAPHFAEIGVLPKPVGADPAVWDAIGAAGAIDAATPLRSPILDFYLTNPIARASLTMAECSKLFVTGADKMAAE